MIANSPGRVLALTIYAPWLPKSTLFWGKGLLGRSVRRRTEMPAFNLYPFNAQSGRTGELAVAALTVKFYTSARTAT
jgi:hypothetical protein